MTKGFKMSIAERKLSIEPSYGKILLWFFLIWYGVFSQNGHVFAQIDCKQQQPILSVHGVLKKYHF